MQKIVQARQNEQWKSRVKPTKKMSRSAQKARAEVRTLQYTIVRCIYICFQKPDINMDVDVDAAVDADNEFDTVKKNTKPIRHRGNAGDCAYYYRSNRIKCVLSLIIH